LRNFTGNTIVPRLPILIVVVAILPIL